MQDCECCIKCFDLQLVIVIGSRSFPFLLSPFYTFSVNFPIVSSFARSIKPLLTRKMQSLGSFVLLFVLPLSYSQINCNPLEVTIDGKVENYFLASAGKSSTSGDSLSVPYGSRAYITSSCDTSFSPSMFLKKIPMLGYVWRFLYDTSSAGCGCNLSLYATAMPAISANGTPAPTRGSDYYCDANDVEGFWCTEMDVLETNVAALQSTLHACALADNNGYISSCDKSGCGQNTRKISSTAFGPGSSFTIDTRSPFNVTAAFPVDANGILTSVTTTLSQGSRTLTLPVSCNAGNYKNASLGAAAGMVPIVSVWGSQDSGSDMTWLDSPPCDANIGCAIANGSGIIARLSSFTVEKL
jgi:hypothetical protein